MMDIQNQEDNARLKVNRVNYHKWDERAQFIASDR